MRTTRDSVREGALETRVVYQSVWLETVSMAKVAQGLRGARVMRGADPGGTLESVGRAGPLPCCGTPPKGARGVTCKAEGVTMVRAHPHLGEVSRGLRQSAQGPTSPKMAAGSAA